MVLPDCSEDLLALIKRVGLLRSLIIEQIKTDLAMEVPAPTREDVLFHLRQVYGAQFSLDSLLALSSQQSLDPDEFVDCVANSLRFKNWCNYKYGSQLPSLFLEFKRELTSVSFSVIRLDDYDLGWEIYHRLVEREDTFAELASRYSLGAEKSVGGSLGWSQGDSIPQAIAPDLLSMNPGDILRPVEIDGFWCVVRLDSRIDPTLDEDTSRLLVEKKGLQEVVRLYERSVRLRVATDSLQ